MMKQNVQFKSIQGVFDQYFIPYEKQLEQYFEQISNPFLYWKKENKDRCIQNIIDQVLDQLVRVSSFSLIDFYTIGSRNLEPADQDPSVG